MAQSAYSLAKAGGRHSGLYRRYRDDPEHLLRRAVASFERRIAEHRRWIEDPATKVGHGLARREVDYLRFRKWPADIQRLTEERDVIQGILEDRRGHGSTT